MTPGLIAQLRLALRKNGLQMADVKAYAGTVKLPPPDEPSASAAAPAAAATVDTLSPRKEKLKNLVAQATASGPLAAYQGQILAKIDSTTTAADFNQLGNELMKLLQADQKIQSAGAPAQDAFKGLVQATAAELKVEPNKPVDTISSNASQFLADANQALASKAQALALMEKYPNLKQYSLSGTDPVQVKVPYVGSTDSSIVVALPLGNGAEAMALGFAAKRNAAWLTSDAGRVADKVLGHLFDITKGDQISTIKHAIKTADNTIQKGRIELPL